MLKLNYTSEEKSNLCSQCNELPYPLYKCKNKHEYCLSCSESLDFSCEVCSNKEDLTKSDDTSLDQIVVSCRSCGHVTVFSEMENHYNQCLKVTIECENCGFLVFRKEYKSHCEMKCHIRWHKECPFGCNTTGFTKQHLEEHRKEKKSFHLDILHSTLARFGLDNILLSADQKDKLKFGFHDDLRKDVTNDFIEFQNLNEEVIYLKKRIRLKRFEKKEQMHLLERSISLTILTSYNGKLTWIFEDSDENATTTPRFSPIFYTGKYGYKLQLILRKTEDSQEISLKFLPWAYDPILPKSFKTSSKLFYKLKDDAVKDKIEIITFDRLKDATGIDVLSLGSLEWIKYEIDCSEFNISSVD